MTDFHASQLSASINRLVMLLEGWVPAGYTAEQASKLLAIPFQKFAEFHKKLNGVSKVTKSARVNLEDYIKIKKAVENWI